MLKLNLQIQNLSTREINCLVEPTSLAKNLSNGDDAMIEIDIDLEQTPTPDFFIKIEDGQITFWPGVGTTIFQESD